ncbi:hypothetical protein MKW92_003761 [Papaver armeniacum]|nr:hypothetical protein MKW92_003761 [Papaver armeniacum]
MIRFLPKDSLANCEVSLADEDQVCKKFRLKVEDVKRKMLGMDFTTDKLRSLVRKWTTLIKKHIDQRDKQVKRTCYAQSSHILEVKLCLSISTFYVHVLQ